MQNSLLFTASLCSIMMFSFSAKADFERIKGYQKPVVYEEEIPFQPVLMRVWKIHQLQQNLNQQDDVLEDVNEAMASRDLSQKRYEAMTQCNVNRLKEFYADPETAWQNITNTYDEAEKKLAVSILQSKATEPTSTQEQEYAEQMAYWDLGREILKDVYANPEKYGKQKNQFPLWRDQQYIYVQQITDFVMAVNTFFSRKGAIPGLRQENSYHQNQQAYRSFLRQMGSTYPELLKKLPTELASLPPPPKALPPAQEIVVYFSEPEQTKSVYPEWPAPWKEFIDSDFEKYNPIGEMAQDFVPKTLRLNTSFTQKDPALQNNRLNVYQDLKKVYQASQKNLKIYQDLAVERYNDLSETVKELELPVPDWQDKASVTAFKQTLIDEKLKNIQLVKELLEKRKKRQRPQTSDVALQVGTQVYQQQMDNVYGNPDTEYQDFLEAVKKDIEGRTSLSFSNAKNVQQYLDEEEASQALRQEALKAQQMKRKKDMEQPIDKTCMNGGF